jgi:hypothetical protein
VNKKIEIIVKQNLKDDKYRTKQKGKISRVLKQIRQGGASGVQINYSGSLELAEYFLISSD